MRTVLTRFFPFSQDQTPIWNEFWYNCSISLQAKRRPAMAGHSLSVIREWKICQTCGPAFPNPSIVRLCLVKPKPWETQSCSVSTELPPRCTAFRNRKGFCSRHAGCTAACPTTPPPHCVLLPLCCRIICSRWEVNTLCFLFLSLLRCLLLQFILTSTASFLLQLEVNWPFSVQQSHSWPCFKCRAVVIAVLEDWDGKQFIGCYLACYQPLLNKDFLPWKAMERIPVTSDIFGSGLLFPYKITSSFRYSLISKMTNFQKSLSILYPGENAAVWPISLHQEETLVPILTALSFCGWQVTSFPQSFTSLYQTGITQDALSSKK